REYQRDMLNKVELGGTAEGVEFSGSAEVVNKLFTSERETTIRQYIDVSAEYIILRITGISLADALLPAVRDASQAAARSVEAAREFYVAHGTHVVKGAAVGGQMRVTTDLNLTSATSKRIVETDVKIDAEAKLEADAYASRKIGFHDRTSQTNSDFRS